MAKNPEQKQFCNKCSKDLKKKIERPIITSSKKKYFKKKKKRSQGAALIFIPWQGKSRAAHTQKLEATIDTNKAGFLNIPGEFCLFNICSLT